MTRLFLNLGKAQRINPGDIAGMMHNELNIPRGSVGKITLFPKHTLIDVSNDYADTAIEGARTAKLRGKNFILDRDRGRGGDSKGGHRGGGGGGGRGRREGGGGNDGRSGRYDGGRSGGGGGGRREFRGRDRRD